MKGIELDWYWQLKLYIYFLKLYIVWINQIHSASQGPSLVTEKEGLTCLFFHKETNGIKKETNSITKEISYVF